MAHWCGIGITGETRNALAAKFQSVFPRLDKQQRRDADAEPVGRVRRPGRGLKRAADLDPDLVPATTPTPC